MQEEKPQRTMNERLGALMESVELIARMRLATEAALVPRHEAHLNKLDPSGQGQGVNP